ncbi:MAG TPA: hypothetical protein VGV08_02900, partial [Casimicrobiaceae bacterium]|nr:hypothetical protein [Casimicrobiaceae bacterium]
DEALDRLADPRAWRAAPASDAVVARLHALAVAGLDARTTREEDAARDDMRRALVPLIRSGDGGALAKALAEATALPAARYLWRALEAAEREAGAAAGALATTLFAIPVVVVAGRTSQPAHARLPAAMQEREGLAALLREHRALEGCETFALATALTRAEAIDLPRLPALLAQCRIAEGLATAPMPSLAVPAADLDLRGAGERVFLRFVVGVALTAAGFDPLRGGEVGRWGMPFAQRLSAGLAVPGASVLALPRAPARLVAALRIGRTAQREIGAQVFASNAIRRLRASVGEPTAVISAHRADDAPGGGELRLSLSSPFEPRDAEGFRCPLHPYDAVRDVAGMLVSLLDDCRVSDVRVQPGVHPDVDATTGLRLLFKETDAGARFQCR